MGRKLQNSEEGVRLFWSLVKKGPGCWKWLGSTSPSGYSFNVPNSLRRKYGSGRAHRIVLFLSGITIPKDMVVDHVCRNTRCVNPKHLRIVSVRTNALENNVGIAATNSKKTHCVNGHEFSKTNTRIAPDGHRSCITCGNAWAKNYQRRRRKLLKERTLKSG